MRVISFNANGIRSAASKGFFDWMNQINPDVVCIQETKAQEHQLQDALFNPLGYHCYYVDAVKKGYSGVAIYSKQKPKKVSRALGWELSDSEGRYIHLEYPGLSIASLYLPSGSSGDERQSVKFDYMDKLYEILAEIRRGQQEFILCGDWNIVHKEIDIKNFKGNQKNSGCLPEERAWIDKVFTELGLVDAFRVKNQEAEQYTWWSFRRDSFNKNVGWRIDYQIVTPGLASKIREVDILKTQQFSDHAPLIIDYEWNL